LLVDKLFGKKMVKCAKVEKRRGEATRQKLIAAGVFDPSFVPEADESYVYFAVKKPVKGVKLVERRLRSREIKFRSIQEALRGKLSERELEEVVRSFDVVGDVAVVEIPPKLERKEKLIAEAIMEVHRNVKAVARKMGPMEGEFRVRKLKVIAGEKRTLTVYKEHGARMKVDLAKAYFSPRLAFERKRVAEKVRKGEKILVMFAGVGPFALVIARKQPNVEIAAVELNPEAVKLMRENVEMNGLREVVKVVLGDVHEVVPKKFVKWADRILMPLPMGAHEFLAEAFLAARKGCVVHFYHFGPMGKAAGEAKKLVKAAARKAGRKAEFLEERVVRPYSPQTEQAVVDFKIR